MGLKWRDLPREARRRIVRGLVEDGNTAGQARRGYRRYRLAPWSLRYLALYHANWSSREAWAAPERPEKLDTVAGTD